MRQKTLRLTSLLAAVLLAAAVPASVVSAQSTLQTTTSGNLQPQTAQTQNSANTQNQVDTLQNNNSQDVLNQNGYRPLGVVSDPRQTTPEAVALPSKSLKTAPAIEDGFNPAPYIALSAFIAAASGLYLLTRTKSNSQTAADVSAATESPLETTPKKQKRPKKKRKHSHRR